jgi:hypothetical protein
MNVVGDNARDQTCALLLCLETVEPFEGQVFDFGFYEVANAQQDTGGF